MTIHGNSPTSTLSSAGFWATRELLGECLVVQEINLLRNELKRLDQLNLAERGLLSFTRLPVMDYAFFPGGNGLRDGINAKKFPLSGALILGSDFGCSTKFVTESGELVNKRSDERGGPTWKPMLELLFRASIDCNKCFYSNAWPFLHKPSDENGDSNDNPPVNIWLRDAELMDACKSFFWFTLKTMNPRFVIALGKGPAAFLGECWPNQLGFWRFNPERKWGTFSWGDLDELFTGEVPFDGRPVLCIAVTHPSKSRLNARHRRHPYQGIEGEVRLLAEAAGRAGIANE